MSFNFGPENLAEIEGTNRAENGLSYGENLQNEKLPNLIYIGTLSLHSKWVLWNFSSLLWNFSKKATCCEITGNHLYLLSTYQFITLILSQMETFIFTVAYHMIQP